MSDFEGQIPPIEYVQPLVPSTESTTEDPDRQPQLAPSRCTGCHIVADALANDDCWGDETADLPDDGPQAPSAEVPTELNAQPDAPAAEAPPADALPPGTRRAFVHEVRVLEHTPVSETAEKLETATDVTGAFRDTQAAMGALTAARHALDANLANVVESFGITADTCVRRLLHTIPGTSLEHDEGMPRALLSLAGVAEHSAAAVEHIENMRAELNTAISGLAAALEALGIGYNNERNGATDRANMAATSHEQATQTLADIILLRPDEGV